MKENRKLKIKYQKYLFFAFAVSGEGISGSDRIFVELARNWSKTLPVTIFTSFEGERLCKIQNLKGNFLKVAAIRNKPFEKLFLLNYLFKIIKGIWLGFSLKLTANNSPSQALSEASDQQPSTVIYSASEFWMDSLPCLLLKLRYKNKIKWIASWYQTAPNPLRGFVEQRTIINEQRTKTYKISAFLYWLVQLPIKPLIEKFADKVVVNNEDEKKRFPKHTSRGDTIVLIGAVPLSDINKYIKKQKTANKKQYDAVFQGRFHPQKGVVELIDIWRKVVDRKPDAKLAMIGDGPLMKDVTSKIHDLGLEKNIKLFGYVFDGPKKFKIFAQSKIVVHPAFYDSGGMASAEAMAFGLPSVGFDLKAYESYYPHGMIKVETGNEEKFADAVVELLNNEKTRTGLGNEAKKMIENNWSWQKRSQYILSAIIKK